MRDAAAQAIHLHMPMMAHNRRRFEAPTSGFYKQEMAGQWYFQAHGASAPDMQRKVPMTKRFNLVAKVMTPNNGIQCEVRSASVKACMM